MIRLKKILNEVNYQFKNKKPKQSDFEKEAMKYLYIQDKNGKWVVTEKTLKEYLDAVIPPNFQHISDTLIKKFDFNVINQFASDKKGSNVTQDTKTIADDWNWTLRNR